jgi:hypothetical protein
MCMRPSAVIWLLLQLTCSVEKVHLKLLLFYGERRAAAIP